MRLSVTMVAQDNAKYGYRDALQELKYCGYDVPERKEITNENIRFYAWLCRMAVIMLKVKECEIKCLEAKQPKKGKWRVYEGVMKCCVCGEEYDDDIMQYFGDSVPAFCPSCGADMRKDGEQECMP